MILALASCANSGKLSILSERNAFRSLLRPLHMNAGSIHQGPNSQAQLEIGRCENMPAVRAPPGRRNASGAIVYFASPLRLGQRPHLNHWPLVQAAKYVLRIEGPFDIIYLVNTGVQLHNLQAESETSEGQQRWKSKGIKGQTRKDSNK